MRVGLILHVRDVGRLEEVKRVQWNEIGASQCSAARKDLAAQRDDCKPSNSARRLQR